MRETLRLLHVNSGNLYGGVETILVTLARMRALCPSMNPHYAVCHEGRLSQELLQAGVPVYVLGQVRISRPWTVWRGRRRLREVLRRERFDMVVCHMPWSLAVFGKAVRAAGDKLGFWAHSFHAGRALLERWARGTKPDLAIGNSRFTEGGLANLFPGVPHGVVYPPLELAARGGEAESRASVRKQAGVSDDTVVIIQVSRMEPCKGHALHLEALAKLQHLDTPWECWMVGGAQRPQEEEYLNELKLSVGKLGLTDRVKFLGQRADVRQLLAGADIFCQPNESPDSFGLVFVEALWAGRPVVTTALGGALEIIDDSCGTLVEPGNVAGLADALRRLIESPELRSRLGGAGLARASSLCDPARQMQALSELSSDVSRSTIRT